MKLLCDLPENMDALEVHSQGLEALFLHFYPEIFGETAPAGKRMIRMVDMPVAAAARLKGHTVLPGRSAQGGSAKAEPVHKIFSSKLSE